MNNDQTMRFGRAMHMDLARASDEKLAAAYKVLSDYDDAGLASAYTQDRIDARLAEIDDEGDRRNGVEPAPWPVASVYVIGVPGIIAEYDAESGARIVRAKPAKPAKPAPSEEDVFNALDAVAFDPAQVPGILDRFEREGADVSAFREPVASVDGMVPGETSAI